MQETWGTPSSQSRVTSLRKRKVLLNVSSLFESRQEAKKEGNEAMSYVYKILMNSLYGRLGISPKFTTTDVCDEVVYKDLLRNPNFIFGAPLSEDRYIVSYYEEPNPDSWNPIKNSAIQLAAAITACARIYMYPYTSREDCYYTDTDSVVLAHPLPDAVVSSSALGKYKLEDKIAKGYFLAPKCYKYITMDGSNVLKFKGPAKGRVDSDWFEEQYTNIDREQYKHITANFRIDWQAKL